MELRHLEHFLTLAEELNFTRAAARMNLVQSALSVSIRNLEKDLGAILFDRTTHGVSLSRSGEALLPEARRVLRDADAARDAVAAVRGVVRGPLRIGIMQSLTLIDAAGLFATFHREHPDVVIQPRPPVGSSVGLVDQVRRGDLDLALTWQPEGRTPDLRVATLAREPFVLVAPATRRLPDADLTLADLDGEEFVEFPVGWGARTVTDCAFLAGGIGRTVAVEVADVHTCTELVRAGFGIAIMPRSLVVRTAGLTLRRITGLPEWGVSLVTSRTRPLTAAGSAFAHLACETFGTALHG